MPLFSADKPRQALDEPIFDRLIDENGLQSALAPAETAVAPTGGIHGNGDGVLMLLGLAVLHEPLDHASIAGKKRDRDGFEMRDLLIGLCLRIFEQGPLIGSPSPAET